jgi:hypothetical protein
MASLRPVALVLVMAILTLSGHSIEAGGGTTNLPPPPPPGLILTDFEGSNEFGTVWCFTGTVLNNTGAQTITVNFSNMPAVDGRSVQCESDGSFVFIVRFPRGQDGVIIAQAVDNLGNTSNQAEDLVSN